ncbi:hypothetical protein U1Q18_015848, partial [Sarracenia purpurea var. burkii]
FRSKKKKGDLALCSAKLQWTRCHRRGDRRQVRGQREGVAAAFFLSGFKVGLREKSQTVAAISEHNFRGKFGVIDERDRKGFAREGRNFATLFFVTVICASSSDFAGRSLDLAEEQGYQQRHIPVLKAAEITGEEDDSGVLRSCRQIDSQKQKISGFLFCFNGIRIDWNSKEIEIGFLWRDFRTEEELVTSAGVIGSSRRRRKQAAKNQWIGFALVRRWEEEERRSDPVWVQQKLEGIVLEFLGPRELILEITNKDCICGNH